MKQQQLKIIKDVHEGVCRSTYSKVEIELIQKRLRLNLFKNFRYSIYKDVESYIKSCENYQKQVGFKAEKE